MYIHTYIYMYVCTYACICMYAGMYVYIHIRPNRFAFWHLETLAKFFVIPE